LESYPTIVAGGGLAGLAAGTALPDALVLEQGEVPGGLLLSPKQDGFTIDLVPHIFFTAEEKAITFFEEKVGQGNFYLKDSDARVFSHNALTRFPFQSCLHGLPAEAIVDCILELANAKGQQVDNITDFQQFADASFGRGITRRFLEPYNKKLWGVEELSQLTADWVGAKVITVAMEDVLAGAIADQKFTRLPNKQFRYPIHGGIQTLAESTARFVNHLELNCPIERIAPHDRQVICADGRKYCYESLIYTLSLTAVPQVIPEAPEAVKEAAQALVYRDVMAVHFGIDRPNVTKWHWMYYPEPAFPFYRVSFPSNMSEETAPEGTSSIICEISVPPDSTVDERELVRTCRQALEDSRILRAEDKALVENVYRLSPAYVVYDHGRNQAVSTIHRYLEQHDIIPAGRFGEWKFFNMDHTILSGLAAADGARARRGRKNADV
jgi:protoporphyrinogen oxidase